MAVIRSARVDRQRTGSTRVIAFALVLLATLSTNVQRSEAASTLQRFAPSYVPDGFRPGDQQDYNPLPYGVTKYFSASPSWFGPSPNLSAERVRVISYRRTDQDKGRLAEREKQGYETGTFLGLPGVYWVGNGFGFAEFFSDFAYIEVSVYSPNNSQQYLTNIVNTIQPSNQFNNTEFAMATPAGMKMVFDGRPKPGRKNWSYRFVSGSSKQIIISSVETSPAQAESDLAFSDDLDVSRIRGKFALRVGPTLVWMERPTQALAVDSELEITETQKIATSLKPLSQKQWVAYQATWVKKLAAQETALQNQAAEAEKQRVQKEQTDAVAQGTAGGTKWFVSPPENTNGAKCYLFSIGNGRARVCKREGMLAWRIVPIGDQLFVVSVSDPAIETVTVVDPVTNKEIGRLQPSKAATQPVRIAVGVISPAQTPETEVAFGLDGTGTPLVGPLPLTFE